MTAQNRIPLTDRHIAITDVETTGLDARRHEIIEIGMVLVNQKTFEKLDTLEIKVAPLHIERASPKALEINGYNAEEWRSAVRIDRAMQQYAQKVGNALFCAHNMTFDWSFIDAAFKRCFVQHNMDYHRLDLLTIAWDRLAPRGLKYFNLNSIAQFLGLPPELPMHRALQGALLEYEVFKKLKSLDAERR